MKLPRTDSLGRSTFHSIKRRADVRPTDREIRWLKHIERHGPQASDLLFALTQDTHRCKDTALRDLQKLRAGGFLHLPRQQRATARAEFNPYIYDLTKQAKDHMKGLGIDEKTVIPTGHWWHAYAISAFTGSLDVWSQRQGREFIPAHRILSRSGANLAIPIGAERLIPDQLFAIRYPEGYRAFLVEIDCGTEPLRSTQARKSLSKSVKLYRGMLEQNLHRQHYGINASTAILWTFSSPSRLSRFKEMVTKEAGRSTASFLIKLLPDRLDWTELSNMHLQPWWNCAGKEIRGL